MYIPQEIAERIKIEAKKRNIKIKYLLSNAGLGENTLQNMRTSMPKSDTLAAIADQLGVSVDDLLGRENGNAPDDTARSALVQRVKRLSDEQAQHLLDLLESLEV